MNSSVTALKRIVPVHATAPLLACLVATACDSPIVDNEYMGEAICDNLDEGQCLFPFPSNFFRSEENGRGALTFEEGSLPTRSREVDPTEFRRADGYSVMTPIYFTFEGSTLAGTPQWDDVDASLKASSGTVIIDTQTGELIPHWAEIDVFSTKSVEPTPVIALRLPAPLQYDRRYVVAVQGLKDEDGSVLPATRGFAPLRDKEPSNLRGVGQRRDHYEKNVFPVLEKAGVDRKKLQMAWDFTTRTEGNANGMLIKVRDAVDEAIGTVGPDFVIDEVEFDPHPDIARLVRGRAMVPSFLTGTPGQLQKLRIDEQGNPVAEGFEEVEFELQIPVSVWNGTQPGHVMQYGHGLLGNKGQARGGWLRDQANKQGFLILGISMQGMSDGDLAIWLNILTSDLASLPFLTDKIHQGLVNHLAVVRMLKGSFLQETDGRFTRPDGSPVYDPSKIYYYGISQGGTMGSVMMSIQKDITRGVLGVPGAGFSFLLTRATLFVESMGLPIIWMYENDMRDFLAMMGLVQVAFDPVDAVNFLHRVTENTFPDTPPHRVLIHVAREDAQVHNQVSDLVARTAGAKLVSPSVRYVWGLPTDPGPVAGNAMVEYDFGIENFPNELVPMELDHSHGCLRKLAEVQSQIDHFYRTGEIKNFCEWGDGACFVPQEWNEANCR